MKIIKTKYGQITARGLVNFLLLLAAWFSIGYKRNGDLHSVGGFFFLSVLAAICALVTSALAFGDFEDTVIEQAQQIDTLCKTVEELTAKHSRETDAKKKSARISRIGTELTLILDRREIGPHGYSFAHLREMANMSEQGLNPDQIAETLGMETDIVRFFLAVIRQSRQFENFSDWTAATQELDEAYHRVFGPAAEEA